MSFDYNNFYCVFFINSTSRSTYCLTGLKPHYIFLTFFRVLQNLAQINIVNSQNSLGDLNAAAHAQQAAIWQVYGKE